MAKLRRRSPPSGSSGGRIPGTARRQTGPRSSDSSGCASCGATCSSTARAGAVMRRCVEAPPSPNPPTRLRWLPTRLPCAAPTVIPAGTVPLGSCLVQVQPVQVLPCVPTAHPAAAVAAGCGAALPWLLRSYRRCPRRLRRLQEPCRPRPSPLDGSGSPIRHSSPDTRLTSASAAAASAVASGTAACRNRSRQAGRLAATRIGGCNPRPLHPTLLRLNPLCLTAARHSLRARLTLTAAACHRCALGRLFGRHRQQASIITEVWSGAAGTRRAAGRQIPATRPRLRAMPAAARSLRAMPCCCSTACWCRTGTALSAVDQLCFARGPGSLHLAAGCSRPRPGPVARDLDPGCRHLLARRADRPRAGLAASGADRRRPGCNWRRSTPGWANAISAVHLCRSGSHPVPVVAPGVGSPGPRDCGLRAKCSRAAARRQRGTGSRRQRLPAAAGAGRLGPSDRPATRKTPQRARRPPPPCWRWPPAPARRCPGQPARRCRSTSATRSPWT